MKKKRNKKTKTKTKTTQKNNSSFEFLENSPTQHSNN